MEVASVEENHLVHAPFFQEFLAGTVGGCCEVLVGHPFDSVKVISKQIYKNAGNTNLYFNL
jgi:solute carrier family 25 carnitine/acylcarnitine transporter 20/29